MQDATAATVIAEEQDTLADDKDTAKEAVSTHVLVEESQVAKLRELSRRTRIAQSEYLREAVDDVLGKYNKGDKEDA